MARQPDPTKQRKPNPAQKRWGSRPIHAEDTPTDADARAARKAKAGDVGKCRCWPSARTKGQPCSPRTGCDPGCKACQQVGPLYTWKDLRFLDGKAS